jgi:8-oxo-dGTP pyrophosphatase MutT (NUDIX family)
MRGVSFLQGTLVCTLLCFCLREMTAVFVLSDLHYRRPALSGIVTPTKPTPEDLRQGHSVSGPIGVIIEGLTLQAGPHGSLWLRVSGTVLGADFVEAASRWLTEFQKRGRGAFYVAIAESSHTVPEAVQWMLQNNFTFHHYMPGQTTTQTKVEGELVYYRWCGDPSNDKVCQYATSVEGMSALLLSPDEREVLLVWEYGTWKSVSGAILAGETMLQAGAREVFEEVGVRLNTSFAPLLVGGFVKPKARDLQINDNFHAVVMKALSRGIEVDGDEIQLAEWFPIHDLLCLDVAGNGTKVYFYSGIAGKDVIGKATLRRIRNYREGRYMELHTGEHGTVDFY